MEVNTGLQLRLDDLPGGAVRLVRSQEPLSDRKELVNRNGIDLAADKRRDEQVTRSSSGRFDSIPERIRREIEQRIIEGGLQPGDRLGLKRELQQEFGVAGPTVDLALRLLADDGLVSVKRGPGGGVFVDRSRPVLRLGTKRMWARDTQMYAENRELREALTSLLAASAARNQDRDTTKVAELTRIADEVEELPVEAFETQQRIWEGQRVLLELCDNRTLAAIFDDLLSTAFDVLLTIEPPTTTPETTRERRRVAAHVSLFRAVIDGDIEAAHQFGRLVPVLGAPVDGSEKPNP